MHLLPLTSSIKIVVSYVFEETVGNSRSGSLQSGSRHGLDFSIWKKRSREEEVAIAIARLRSRKFNLRKKVKHENQKTLQIIDIGHLPTLACWIEPTWVLLAIVLTYTPWWFLLDVIFYYFCPLMGTIKTMVFHLSTSLGPWFSVFPENSQGGSTV